MTRRFYTLEDVWWQTPLVAIGSSIVGGVLTIAGSDYLARRQERTRQRDEERRIVSAALRALDELDPSTWADRLAAYDDSRQLAAAMFERWRAAADGLQLLVAFHPRTRVAELAQTVIDGGRLTAIRLDEVARGAGISEPWREAIPTRHAATLEAARELARLIR